MAKQDRGEAGRAYARQRGGRSAWSGDPSSLSLSISSACCMSLHEESVTLSDEAELNFHSDYNTENADLVLIASESVPPRSG